MRDLRILLPLLFIALLPFTNHAQNILVIDYNNAFSSDQSNNNSIIYNRLNATRPTVNRVASVPATISATTYDQVWLFGDMGSVSTTNINPVIAFMNQGGAVYVQSEVGCCNNQAIYLDALIDSTVTSGGSISHSTTYSGYYEVQYLDQCTTRTTYGAACRPFPGTPAANVLFQATATCGGTMNGRIAGVKFRNCDMYSGQGALVGIGDFNVFPSAGNCTTVGILGTANRNNLIDYLADLMIQLVVCNNTTSPTMNIQDTTVCGGSVFYQSPITGSGYSYSWSNGNTTDTATYNSQGTHWLTVQIGPGCSATDTFTITYGNITAAVNANICQGDSLFVGGAYQSTAGTYVDTIQTTNCDSVVTTTLAVNPIKSNNSNISICQGDSVLFGGNYIKAAGNYVDTGQTSFGCDSISSLALTVNPTYQDSGTLVICQGDSALVGGNWRNSSGYYPVVYSSINGCDSVEVINLVVRQPVSVQLGDSVCDGDSLLFGSQYLTVGGTYIDTLTSSYGCDSIVTLSFSIRQKLPITAYGDTTIKIGQSTVIGVTGGTGAYNWTPPTGLSCTACASPTANPSETTWYYVSSGSGGCEAIDSVLVEIDATFFLKVPNVFTPNGDGKNEVFKITAEGVESYELKIFNRWGILLFVRDSGPIEWDGVMTSGKGAVDGTYYFILDAVKYDGDTETRKGSVMLIR